MTKSEFFNQPNKEFFFKNLDAVSNFVKENCKEAQEIIRVADDVANQKFTFTLRWDMERTTEPVVFENDINWLYNPGNDPEWIFAFNRMRFWICLGQAYALTKDEKYTEAFIKQMKSFVENVKSDDENCQMAWRSIEVGLRLEYWLKAFLYFENSPLITDEVVEIFTNSIIDHAEFMMNVWNTFNLMSNWGVLGNHGLFLAGVILPTTDRTKEYIAESIRRLDAEITIQVFSDGCHWEQSPMYHNEVLHCFLDIVLIAKRCNITLPENIIEKTHKMCLASALQGKPNHCEISMGDSDNIDQRDLISRGAYIFNDSLLKSRGYDVPDFDTAWEIGDKGLFEYINMNSTLPENTDVAFYESSNFYFRNDYSENATFLHFHCGISGAGHGHCDKLHFDIFSRGEDVFVDAGRYTYVFGAGREEFKEHKAHNVPMVDNRELYVQKDSWECFDLNRAINQKFKSTQKYGYTEGGYLAYMSPEGVFVNRKIVYIKPDIFIICDEFYGNGEHTYNQFFHLNNTGTLEKCDDTSFVYTGDNVKANIKFVTNGVKSDISDSKISRHYNQYDENKFITTSFKGNGFTSAYTVICLSDKQANESICVEKHEVKSNFKGITFDDSQIETLTVKFGKEEYTVVIAHDEYASPTDTFSADGCNGVGAVVVFDRQLNETEIGTILSR